MESSWAYFSPCKAYTLVFQAKSPTPILLIYTFKSKKSMLHFLRAGMLQSKTFFSPFWFCFTFIFTSLYIPCLKKVSNNNPGFGIPKIQTDVKSKYFTPMTSMNLLVCSSFQWCQNNTTCMTSAPYHWAISLAPNWVIKSSSASEVTLF